MAQSYNIYASLLGFVPNLTFGGSGIGGSPHVTAQWTAGNIISALQVMSAFETQLGSAASYEAGSASTLAGYERRYNDWMLQAELATKELDQPNRQIAAAELRVSIADKELQNQALLIDNAQAN